MSDPYFELLQNAQPLEAVYYKLYDVTGPFGIVTLFFAIFAMMWLKNQDMTIPTIIAILLGGAIFAVVPAEFQQPAYILVGFGMASILYRVFKS